MSPEDRSGQYVGVLSRTRQQTNFRPDPCSVPPFLDRKWTSDIIRFKQEFSVRMQAAELKLRSGSGNLLREWVRIGIVIPTSVGVGKGQRADYDEASLLAAIVARLLNEMHVVVSHYISAFEDLHNQLRTLARKEWLNFVLLMTPMSARLLPIEAHKVSVEGGHSYGAILIVLKSVCEDLFSLPHGHQLQIEFSVPLPRGA